MISEEQHNELRKRFSPDGSTLRKTQMRLLEMLKFFDSICKQHNIKYWLSSGTLLGAVRHGAFIPWDDDLDVEMLEDDYKKMCAVLENLQHDDYVLQNHNTDPNFYRRCSKLRDKHSYVEERYGFDLNYKYRGLFIDIFCLEPSSFGKLVRITGGLENKVLYKLSTIKHNRIRNFLVKPLYLLLSKIVYPILSFFSKICGNGQTYRHRMGIGFHGPRYIDDLLPLTTIKFEDHEFPAPNNMDHYLSVLFGEYMKLPNLDKVEVHATEIEFYD